MGRHSAPDDGDDVDAGRAATLTLPSVPRGRHARPDDGAADEAPARAVANQTVAPQGAGPPELAAPDDVAGPVGPDVEDTQEFAPVGLDMLVGADDEVDTGFDADTSLDTHAAQAADELTAAQKQAALAAAKAAGAGGRGQRKAERAALRENEKLARAQEKQRAKAERGETNTQADLRLLRTNRALRWECFGSMVFVFAVYTGVMFALHRTHMYLFWLWIPIIVSFVAFGAWLDAAHRKPSESERADSAS